MPSPYNPVSLLRLTQVRYDLSGSFISWWYLEKPYLLKMNPDFQVLLKDVPQMTATEQLGQLSPQSLSHHLILLVLINVSPQLPPPLFPLPVSVPYMSSTLPLS